jgi:hypothetical protein
MEEWMGPQSPSFKTVGVCVYMCMCVSECVPTLQANENSLYVGYINTLSAT